VRTSSRRYLQAETQILVSNEYESLNKRYKIASNNGSPRLLEPKIEMFLLVSRYIYRYLFLTLPQR